jgi:hypothetical protein
VPKRVNEFTPQGDERGAFKNALSSTLLTRTAATEIWARLETWEGAVDLTLDRGGDYTLRECQSKHGTGEIVAQGNVNAEPTTRYDQPPVWTRQRC